MGRNVDSAVTMPLGMDADIDRDFGMDMDTDHDSDGLTCPKCGLCSRGGGGGFVATFSGDSGSEPKFLNIYWRLKSRLFEESCLFKGQCVQ